jgi:hypothetical protein
MHKYVKTPLQIVGGSKSLVVRIFIIVIIVRTSIIVRMSIIVRRSIMVRIRIPNLTVHIIVRGTVACRFQIYFRIRIRRCVSGRAFAIVVVGGSVGVGIVVASVASKGE